MKGRQDSIPGMMEIGPMWETVWVAKIDNFREAKHIWVEGKLPIVRKIALNPL